MDQWAAIVIVDADAAFRGRAIRTLSRAGLVVQECASGEEALAAAAAVRPAAVIVEAELPDVDGLAVCRELRDRYGDDLPLILVSRKRVRPHDRVAGLLIGADDYLAKPVNDDELLARVRRLLARSGPAATTGDARPNGLSPRELEVLRLLASGLSAIEIAERLVISRKTVSTHVQRILAKLGVHSRTQAVAEAYRLGLVPPGAAQARAAS